MSTITFDTLKLVDTLEKVAIPREQARAIVEVVRESRDTTLADQAVIAQEASERATLNLDTKTEQAVSRLDTKLDREVSKLESGLALVRKDIDLLRWMLTAVLGGIVALMVRAFF